MTACLVAACTPEPGQPVAAPGSSSAPPVSPVTTPQRTPVTTFTVTPPTVSRSLDVLPWTFKVCDLLTDPEAAEIGVSGPAVAGRPDEQGGRCTRDGDSRLTIRMYGRYEEVTNLLLTTDYKTEYIAEATVSGQPAIVVSNERTPTEKCTVGVMLARRQSLQVDLKTSAQGPGDVCDRALIAAERAVGRIAG
ncbi:DUF3558 family protein [Actinokineospora sp. NPDC004072]